MAQTVASNEQSRECTFLIIFASVLMSWRQHEVAQILFVIRLVVGWTAAWGHLKCDSHH
jgi:hypothetical protein